jgi:hypothetical protein
VFERVIQEVCDASQVDFEESGVDQQTLADLRNVSDFFSSFLCFHEMSLSVDGEPLDGGLSLGRSGGAREMRKRRMCWGTACF